MSDWVDAIGKPAAESVAATVACLRADRERLRELRDERQSLVDSDRDSAIMAGDDVAQDIAERAIIEWDRDHADELAELEAAVTLDGEELDEEQARERIEQDPLSLRVFGERLDGEWRADRFELLLAWGGPGVRIVGELDDGEPVAARLEVQDWFKPWTEYHDADSDTLLDYCRCFYYGE